MCMTRSELIGQLAQRFSHLPPKRVDRAVKQHLDHMSEGIASGERGEIRRFGSFSRKARQAIKGRNPKTGEAVQIPATSVARFRPGKPLGKLVNAGKVHTRGIFPGDNL
jgi:integration host factor subunit beta